MFKHLPMALLAVGIIFPLFSAEAQPGAYSLTDHQDRCGSLYRPKSGEVFSCRTKSLLEDFQRLGLPMLSCRESTFRWDIAALLKEVNEITYLVRDFGEGAGSPARWSAFYLPKQKTVFLNSERMVNPLIASALAFHETLGALGISESRYQISFLAALLYPQALDDATAEKYGPKVLGFLENFACPDQSQNFYFPPFADRLGTFPKEELARGGSGDVVGSGGDPDVIGLKLRLARDLLANAGDAKAGGIIAGLQRADFYLSDSTCDPCPVNDPSCKVCKYTLQTSHSEAGFTAYVSRVILLDWLNPENPRQNGYLYLRLRTAFDRWVEEEYRTL